MACRSSRLGRRCFGTCCRGGGSTINDDVAQRRGLLIAGYALRSFLVSVLRERGRPMTIRQLTATLRQHGFVTQGRASKDISDALRWEIQRGRVRRVARSTYVVGHVTRQTAWRMRKRVEAHRAAAGNCQPEDCR